MDNVYIKAATYENITVNCPKCGKDGIYNRISDLENIQPISGSKIECLQTECRNINWVSGDTFTSSKHEWLLQELHFLERNKKYGLYISTLCQALESFMHQAIINKLIDRNPLHKNSDEQFAYDGLLGTDAYNKIITDFQESTVSKITSSALKDGTKYKKLTFDGLRNMFLHIFDDEIKHFRQPKHNMKDKRVISFDELKNSTLNTVRNDTLHKYAYRPSKQDVADQAGLIGAVYWLQLYLDVKESILILNGSN